MSRLRELREDAVLTVRELAQQSGVSEDAITKIENGHRKARPSTIRKLANVLNVEPRELITSQEVAPTSLETHKETVGQPRVVPASGVARGRSSARAKLTVTVSVPLNLRWDVAEALKGGKKLSPDELRELEEAAREQLTAE